MIDRSAAVYADFLLPHLTTSARLLDCGCGDGSITVGLASAVWSVIGLDISAAAFEPAVAHVGAKAVLNVRFIVGTGAAIPFAARSFDAVLMHSVLETADDPNKLVAEAFRVLTPGGVLAAASVDYGGLVLAGPWRETLERFFAVREQLWALDGVARSRAGRDLRGLLHGGGFTSIDATTRCLSYGTAQAIRSFGDARARECAASWFSSRSLVHRLLTGSELQETKRAWEEWSKSPDSFLAFAWCRVVGRKPFTTDDVPTVDDQS